jgi:DNA repair protein RecO (recombination protein O)
MPSFRARVLVLKKTKLGESDLIVTLLAEDGCQLRAVAKGARKTASRFGARVEPFSVADAMLHTGRTLHVITDVETVASHAQIREDYDRCLAASVAADFLDKSSVECQTDDRLFGLATATLDAMDAAEPSDLPALVVAFLLKGMAMQGYRPQFDACSACGSPVTGDVRFNLDLGGPSCEGCAAPTGQEIVVGAGAVAALRALLGARMAHVGALAVPPPVVAEAFRLVRAFVAYHVPARLKALDLYAVEADRAFRG